MHFDQLAVSEILHDKLLHRLYHIQILKQKNMNILTYVWSQQVYRSETDKLLSVGKQENSISPIPVGCHIYVHTI